MIFIEVSLQDIQVTGLGCIRGIDIVAPLNVAKGGIEPTILVRRCLKSYHLTGWLWGIDQLF
jgi:hypothetical protein